MIPAAGGPAQVHRFRRLDRRARLAISAMLVLVYVASGKLGLMLALPPGYASAIFPPAGVAIAAAMIWGGWTLPAIILGSFLLNVWTGYGAASRIDGTVLAAAAVIAAASALQAAAGGRVLRRATGYPAAIDYPVPLMRFLLLTPVICVISASFSVSGLGLLGAVQAGVFWSSWFTWWIGDTLGVLVMLPLTLVLVGEPRKLWQGRVAGLVMPTLVGFALFVVIFVKVSHWEQGQALLEFKLTAQQVVGELETRLRDQEAVLEQLERGFSGRTPVSDADFRHLVERALARYPMLKALEWAPQVTAQQRAAYEAARGLPITEFDPVARTLRRAGARSLHYPVTYLEPLQGNEAARGYDLASRPGRETLLAAAMRSGRTIATAPLPLVQDRPGEEASPGVLILVPVRGGASGPGFVLGVIRIRDFVHGIAHASAGTLALRMTDVDAGVTVYDTLSAAGSDGSQFESELVLGGRHYRVQAAPSAAYFAGHRGWQSWSVLAAGLLFTGVLQALLMLATGHAARTEEQVAERTLALSEEKTFSDSVIASLPGVFYMVDAEGRFKRWNANYAAVFGHTAEELQGRDIFADVVEEDRPLLRDSFLAVLERGSHEQLELRHRVAEGGSRRLLTTLQRVEAGGRPYVLGNGVDVTERRRLEREVQRSRRVLRTLIDAAPAWLCMIGRDGALLIANRRYSETFGLPLDEIEGQPYAAVLPPDNCARLAGWLEDCFAGDEVEFDDEWSVPGRPLMSVHGKCVPVRDGGVVGTVVAAIMDVTDIRQVQARLEATNAELERRVAEIHALQLQLQEQAIRDPLTGLYNRRYLDEMLERELVKAQREGYPVSIVMGDIDHFKRLNDTYGHQAGDEMLKLLAEFLRQHARSSDILCRFGGEEFLLVLSGVGLEGAHERVERLREEFAAQSVSFGAFQMSATLSFGVSAYPGHGKTADRLIAAADTALYQAKAAGRNRVVAFRPGPAVTAEAGTGVIKS